MAEILATSRLRLSSPGSVSVVPRSVRESASIKISNDAPIPMSRRAINGAVIVRRGKINWAIFHAAQQHEAGSTTSRAGLLPREEVSGNQVNEERGTERRRAKKSAQCGGAFHLMVWETVLVSSWPCHLRRTHSATDFHPTHPEFPSDRGIGNDCVLWVVTLTLRHRCAASGRSSTRMSTLEFSRVCFVTTRPRVPETRAANRQIRGTSTFSLSENVYFSTLPVAKGENLLKNVKQT